MRIEETNFVTIYTDLKYDTFEARNRQVQHFVGKREVEICLSVNNDEQNLPYDFIILKKMGRRHC